MKTTPSNSVMRIGRTVAYLAAIAVMLMAQAMGTASAQSSDMKPSFKDLDIRQLPMAEMIASEAANALDPEHGLIVKAAVDRLDNTYTHGDDLVLTVETTKDAYVWVFDTGTSGKVHRIFPNRHEKNNFVRANMPARIPTADAPYRFLVSHPKGTELITVIASEDDTPLGEDLIDHVATTGPFLALRGTAHSVAKDLSISLRTRHPTWNKDVRVIYIK